MKIPVRLVIDVDPQAWADANGQIVDADGRFATADLRADVRSYVLNAIQSSAMVEETEADVWAS